MTPEERLREWLVALSDMVGGDLEEDSSLEESLEWFGELPEEDLDEISALGNGNKTIRDFLAIGPQLRQACGL